MKLYLAGPDIFLAEAPTIAARKKERCRHHGFIPLHPLDGELAGTGQAETAMAIYRANRGRMLEADAILADLTPFRSPSADPGTVFEVGFMAALGRPIFAYSHTATPFLERTQAALPGSTLSAQGTWHDAAGTLLEDFGLSDNLMIDCALTLLCLPTPAEPEPFEACLAAAARHFQG